VFCYFLGLSIF